MYFLTYIVLQFVILSRVDYVLCVRSEYITNHKERDMSRWNMLFMLLSIGCAGWIGYWAYMYFFDTHTPYVMMAGIEDYGSYAGEIPCAIEMGDEYKVSDLSVWLDEAPLATRHPVNARESTYPLTIDTRNLSQGQHTLSVAARDGTYRRNRSEEVRTFYVDNAPLYAAFVTKEDVSKVFQGHTLHIQFQVNKPIKQAHVATLSHRYPCVPEVDHSHIYECFVPIPSDAHPNEYLLDVHIEDHVGNTTSLERAYHIVDYPFKQQKLNIAAPRSAKEDPTVRSDAELENDLYWYTQNSPHRKLWHGAFFVPCDMQGVSTEYGTLRTTQQYGKYRHDALDILAPPRSVVWASQDGVVVVKDTFERSGHTVVIDHGCGVLTMYFHLDDFAHIDVGQTILRGKPIGYLGKSGYASGYHLHWELRVHNVAVDPMEWTQTQV